MPRPKQSEAQVEAMRERILDAAHVLLRDEGFEALSIRAIAEQVGVSHMTLYTYFENRDALLRALSERQRARFRARSAEILRRAKAGDVCEVVREVLDVNRRISRERPRLYRFLWVQPFDARCRAEHEQLPLSPEDRLAFHLEPLVNLIQLGIEREAFVARDPVVAAATAFSMVNAPLILYHNGRLTDEVLRDRLEVETLDAAMRYLCGRA